MADENTITTVFRADISQFSASTQDLNRYIKQVNSEFAAATAGMGKWSDSTDGLQAKINQLNGVLKAEESKLASLEAQYSDLTDEQKKNSKQGQYLATEINKQSAVVNKTKKQVDDYTGALKELQDAGVKTKQELKDLTDAQNKQGDSAESVAGKIAKGLGGAIAGVAGIAAGAVSGFFGLAESTREYRQGLNQLEAAFGTLGFTADETYEAMNYFGSVLGDTRRAQETMLVLGQLVDSEKELEQWTDTLTNVYATYGEAIPLEGMSEAVVLASKQATAEGGLADALEWGGVNLDDFNDKLESLNTEEERSAYIQETLNKLYSEQGDAYRELNKDVLDASTAQTNLEHAMAKLGAVAEPIMTMLKNATAGFLTALEPFVKLMGEGLTSAFNGSAEGAKTFAEGLSGIITTLLNKANEMLPGITNIILELIPALVSSILGAVPQLVTTLTTVISQIVVALGDMLPQIVTAVVEMIPQLVQALIDALPIMLDACVQFWTAIIEALPTIIEQLLGMLPDVINTIINGLITFIPQLIDGAITLLMAIVDALPTIIEALITEVPKIVNAIIDGLITMLPVLLDGAITLLMAIIDALPTIIKLLIKETPKLVKTITKTLIENLPVLIQAATELFMGIITAIPTICIELIKNLPEIITTICDGLLDGLGDIKEVGLDLIKGLWDGIKGAGEWLWGKIKDFGGTIKDKFKEVFKISSPSKVFADVIGKNLALGIGQGFDNNIDNVADDMATAFSKVTPDLGINVNGLNGVNSTSNDVKAQGVLAQIATLLAGAGGGSNVVNNYSFDYKFERMETSQLALHKAQLETKRILAGGY